MYNWQIKSAIIIVETYRDTSNNKIIILFASDVSRYVSTRHLTKKCNLTTLINAVYTAQYPWGVGGEKANPLGRKLESLAKTKGTRCRYTLSFLKRKGLGIGLGPLAPRERGQGESI